MAKPHILDIFYTVAILCFILCLKQASHKGSKKHEARSLKPEGSLRNYYLCFIMGSYTLMKCEACSISHDQICFTVVEPDLSFASASLIFEGKVSHN
jgi:hypothetical protein